MSRSKRALEVLRFIIINPDKPKTLYEIGKTLKVKDGSRKKLIPWGSLDLAVGNLVRQNLITLNVSESQKRGRNATVYMPTFKGFLTFLADYNLDPPTTVRMRGQSESRTEAVEKLSKIKYETERGYKKQVEALKRIIEKNGKLLRYPLFQNFRSLNLSPRLYITLIRISQALLRFHFGLSSSEKSFLSQKVELEKDLIRAKKLDPSGNRFRYIVNGREEPFDFVEMIRERLEYTNSVLNSINIREEEILKESFFIRFLRWFSHSKPESPNQELYDFTLRLLEKKKNEFNSMKKQLEAGLTLFG